MPLTSLLLLAMVFPAPPDHPAQPPTFVAPTPWVAVVPDSAPVADFNGPPPQSFQLTPSQPRNDAGIVPPDNICYKIRAYIFKRDDDHAPEFVRSTTCGPSEPHAKGVAWPKARIIPAK